MLAGSTRAGFAGVSNRTALSGLRSKPFSTTCCQAAQQRNAGRDSRKGDSDRSAYDISGIERYQFDDTTSYGHMILERKREKLELLRAVERDRSLLERKFRCWILSCLFCTACIQSRLTVATRLSHRCANADFVSLTEQRKSFQPPSQDRCLRFSTTIDLVLSPDASPRETAHTHKSVVHLPISRLPLNDAAAIHRFKLLAGPRWIPPKSVVLQQTREAEGEEEHGSFKMSQDSFGDVRLNRQWLMDTIQRLIQEANVGLPSTLQLVIFTNIQPCSQQRPNSPSRSYRWICDMYMPVCGRSEIKRLGITFGRECRLERRQGMEAGLKGSQRSGSRPLSMLNSAYRYHATVVGLASPS